MTASSDPEQINSLLEEDKKLNSNVSLNSEGLEMTFD